VTGRRERPPARRCSAKKSSAKKPAARKTPRPHAGILARARKICLALPDAHEKIAWGAPTFRVRDRQFAMFLDNHNGDGRVALWIKAPPGAQEALVVADPERFFRPPYVGAAGWLGVQLDKGLDWGVVAGLVRDGYLEAAPLKLRAALGGA
jgi:hypothetical protein